MPVPLDQKLYDRVKKFVYSRYKVHSAYRSGAVVKLYKHMGGRYAPDGHERTLARWFKEKWTDVNPHKTRTSYPVYRPTVRVNSRTPLTVSEVDPKDLRRKSREKQKLKHHTLAHFHESRESRSTKRSKG
jgi:hypothetical protein